jgi:hypothetical protein
MLTWIVCFVLSFSSICSVGAYKLYAKEVVSPYTLNRTNFCAENVDNEADMLAGFSGKEVLMAMDIATNPFYFGYDSTTYAPSGLMFDILTEIESRSGITFVYAYVQHVLTKTDPRLKVFIGHTDIVANTWWTDTPIRRSEGIGFTQAVVDVSLVFVTTSEVESNQFNAWKFLEPYSLGMWGCLLLFIAFHSFLLWAIEGEYFSIIIGKVSEHKTVSGKICYLWNALVRDRSLWTQIYYSWSAMTGMGNADPQHPSAVFLNMGFLFFMMVFVAGYTADLANILLTPPATINRYSSLDDAMNKGAKICLTAGSAAVTYMQAVSSYSFDTSGVNATIVMQNLAYGECDAAIFGNIDWQSLSVRKSNNPYCNLVQVGDVIAPLGGSFIYLPDDTKNCTSLVEQVVSYYIIDMKNDGTLADIIAGDVNDYMNINCAAMGADSGSSQLTLRDLAGTFFVYLIAFGLALTAFGYRHGLRNKKFWGDDSETKDVKEASEDAGASSSNPHRVAEENAGSNASNSSGAGAIEMVGGYAPVQTSQPAEANSYDDEYAH